MMSLKIIKVGILDSMQDLGRYGNRKYGINPTGAMDTFSARKANLIVGNAQDEAVIEMHFPASIFLFENPATIALSGAEFKATIDGRSISLDQPIEIRKNSILQFTQHVKGARCYMSLAGGFQLTKWLNSYSTNFKAHTGGFHGRKLIKDDIISFRKAIIENSRTERFEFYEDEMSETEVNEIMILSGPEWNWLSIEYQNIFLDNDFLISAQSDRMGFRLNGKPVFSIKKEEKVSSPVCFGTIQLLPGGNLIVLMADHQTTGGYPSVANVITAHHSRFAQKKPGDIIHFKMTDIPTAEKLILHQEKKLMVIKNRLLRQNGIVEK